MNNKLQKNKSGEKFSVGLFIILLTTSISLFAFITEENKVTGYATLENTQEEAQIIPQNLIGFNNVNSLSTLSAGNYYIDSKGIVYWVDDESSPAIAKIQFIDESQKNRYIYIDDNGRVGYVLITIE